MSRESSDYAGKTAQEWHDVALAWKRRALNAEIAAKTAERDADLLAHRLCEEGQGFEPERVMDDLAVDLRPRDAEGAFRD